MVQYRHIGGASGQKTYAYALFQEVEEKCHLLEMPSDCTSECTINMWGKKVPMLYSLYKVKTTSTAVHH